MAEVVSDSIVDQSQCQIVDTEECQTSSVVGASVEIDSHGQTIQLGADPKNVANRGNRGRKRKKRTVLDNIADELRRLAREGPPELYEHDERPVSLPLKRRYERTWRVNCCVEGCPVNDSNSPDARLFAFPSNNVERRNLWIRLVRPCTNINFHPSTSHRVCDRHFVPEELECGNPSDHTGPDPSRNLPIFTPLHSIGLREPGSSIHANMNAPPRLPNETYHAANKRVSRGIEADGGKQSNVVADNSSFLLNSITDVSEEIAAIREEVLNLEKPRPENEVDDAVNILDSGFENNPDHPLAQFGRAFHVSQDSSEIMHGTQEKEKVSKDKWGQLLPCCRDIPEIKKKIERLNKSVDELHGIMSKMMKLKKYPVKKSSNVKYCLQGSDSRTKYWFRNKLHEKLGHVILNLDGPLVSIGRLKNEAPPWVSQISSEIMKQVFASLIRDRILYEPNLDPTGDLSDESSETYEKCEPEFVEPETLEGYSITWNQYRTKYHSHPGEAMDDSYST